jgi:hypothetical protein
MKTATGEWVPPEETNPRRKGWPLSRWLLLIALVLAAHVALIFTFGTRKAVAPRAATNAPKLELVNGAGEWLTLNDPTLFALPNREGFAGSAWLEPPHLLPFQMPDWTEKPRWLELSNEMANLGAVFSQFMRTNRFAAFQFDVKPPAQFTVPVVPLEPTFAQTSTLRVEGDLAKRPLLTSMELPSWPYADVIAPSKVQVLVNAAGEVVSAVLLPSNNPDEVHDADADQRALVLARAARFAPAPGLTVGQLIFDWRTVAPPLTNAPTGP